MIEKRAFHVDDLWQMTEIRGSALGERNDYLDFEKSNPCITHLYNGRVMACGGLQIPWAGMAEVWLFLARDAGPHSVLAVREQLDEWIRDYRLRRVQCVVLYLWKEARRLVEWMGFEYEGRLRCYWRNGEDMAMYGKIRWRKQ